jgi:hypothetical protein
VLDCSLAEVEAQAQYTYILKSYSSFARLMQVYWWKTEIYVIMMNFRLRNSDTGSQKGPLKFEMPSVVWWALYNAHSQADNKSMLVEVD